MGHHWGTKLAWFWGTHADRVLQRKSFAEFLKVDLDLPMSKAYRLARIARYANARQATRGAEWVLACASLVDFLFAHTELAKSLGVRAYPKTISDLGPLVLTLASGKPVRIEQASATTVEEALELLRKRVGDGTARLPKAGRELQDDLRDACRTDPDLKGVDVRLRRGKSGTRLVLVVESGVNLEKAGRALTKVIAGRA